MAKRFISHVRSQWMGGLALMLVLAGGGAYAAFDPVGGDGDIDACFAKKSGDLDVLKGKKCGKGEKPVTWNQVGPEGPQGERGPDGLQGTPGANGQQGPPGISGLEQVFNSTASNSESAKLVTATCPAGKHAIGGGATHSGGTAGAFPNMTSEIIVSQIQPTDEDTVPGAVTVSAFENTAIAGSWSLTAFVQCASVG